MENVGMKAAVQVYEQAEELKTRLVNPVDIFGDNEIWSYHHELQRLYRRLLLMDLEFALDKKVEQDLWNCIFKNQITLLQTQAKDKKNQKRVEATSTLGWFLESASGFYFQLLQEMCLAFELDLPVCRKTNECGYCEEDGVEGVVQPHRTSCYYICQHILVHLGDIARYRSQPSHAQTFYRHAVSLVPTSGHPYNQLALLEAGRGDKLSTVYYYVRSIAVRNPFPVAKTNLAQIFNRVLADDHTMDFCSGLVDESEFLYAFLQFHALLHAATDFLAASTLARNLCETLTSLVATEALSAWRMVQIITITLSVYYENNGEGDAAVLCCDMLAALLNAALLPTYTRKPPNTMEDYYALPAVKVLLDWIRGDISVLKQLAFTSRPHIWPSLCQLLNNLNQNDLQETHYNDVALPEDRDLQGFLPLQKVLRAFKVREPQLVVPEHECRMLRANRLRALGRWLSKQSVLKITPDGLFQPINKQQPSSEVIKQLEELSLNKDKPEKFQVKENCHNSQNSVIPRGLTPEELALAAAQKRPGILKPNSTEVLSGNDPKPARLLSAPPSVRKARQNVALNTIMKKSTLAPEGKGELKQVTFKTPSPSISPCSSGGSQPDYQPNHRQLQVSPNLRPSGMISQIQQQPFANQQRGKNLPPRLAAQYGQLPNMENHVNSTYGPPGGELKTGVQQNYSSYTNQFPIGSGYMSVGAPRNITTPPQEINRPSGPPWWSDNQDANNSSGDGSSLLSSGSAFPRLPDYKSVLGMSTTTTPAPIPQPKEKSDVTPPYFNPSVPPPTHRVANPLSLAHLLNQLQRNAGQETETFNLNQGFQQTQPLFHDSSIANSATEEKFNNGFPGIDSIHATGSPLDNLPNTYSLFSTPGPSWTARVGQRNDAEPRMQVSALPSQSALQCLWSGPGPSPLERLLEQQKQKREGLPNS